MSAQKNNGTKRQPGKHRARRAFARWHRRIGLLSALAVLLLSTTGIALNHLDALVSEDDYVSSEWLIDWYGIEPASEILQYQSLLSSLSPVLENKDLENSSLENKGVEINWADGTISINKQATLFNQSQLLGVVGYAGITHVFTASELHLFSGQGERIESIVLSASATIEAVYRTSDPEHYIVSQNGKTRLYDLSTLEWQDNLPSSLAEAENLKSEIRLLGKNHSAYSLSRHHSLLKSKVLQDLHNGSFFGRFGSLVLDFFAFCFILLAGSGVITWYSRTRA